MLKYDARRDYYAILGVPDTASPQEIKTAFRKLMRAAHPDVNRDRSEAKHWAQDLNEAFDVLSTDRAAYDMYRQEAKAAEAAKAAAPKRKVNKPKAPAAARRADGPSAGDILAGLAIGLGAVAVVGGIGAAVASALSDDD